MTAIVLYLLGMVYAWAFNNSYKMGRLVMVLAVIMWPVVAALTLPIGIYRAVTK